jgi:O-antigen/teichoic acid export membrane protein
MDNKNDLDKSLESLAKSAIVVFIGIFLSKVFVYVYRIIIARKFGAEIYGIFSLAIMIAGIFMLISNLGLTGGLSRYIPKFRGTGERDKISYIFKKSLNVLFITSIVSFGVLRFFS